MSGTQSHPTFPKAEFLELNTAPGISYYIIVPYSLPMYFSITDYISAQESLSVEEKKLCAKYDISMQRFLKSGTRRNAYRQTTDAY
jgi:hypothetical protein